MDAESAANRVLVFARVRPSSAHPICVETLEETRAVHVREATSAQEFVFDGVFPPAATQEQVFASMGFPVVRECLKGFNGSIIAYGQTGSGKTHSLLNQDGLSQDFGLLPRVVDQIFNHIALDVASVYEVEAAAIQVYNEQIDDLLHLHHKSGNGHNMSVTNSGDVPGLTWVPCRSASELSRTFSRARTNLVYAETKMNKASSRSHAIFQIKVTKHGESDVTFSRLSIVDLAGSERVKKSGVDGIQFKEATNINKSLLAFGNVVSALVAKKKHVPFRDSKLTHVLSPCIGSNCKTSLLVCSSPAEEHVAETLCSLEFASRAMHIEVHARMNRMIQSKSEAVVADPVAARRADDADLRVQEHELAGTKQALVEACGREEEAHARAASAILRAEQAESRASIAERDVQEWQERYAAAAAEITSTKAACAVAEARAQTAEQVANEWKTRCEDTMRRSESLETKLAEATRDVQLRRTQLCETTAALERAQAEHVQSDKLKEEAVEANHAAQLAAARASQLDAESQKIRALAHANVAAANAEKARANREAQLLAFESEQARSSLETLRASWNQERDDEEERLAKKQKSLEDKLRDVMQRESFVDGLEAEKRELAKQEKLLEEQRQEMQLEKRRLRNGIIGSGPPPLHSKSSPGKPTSLSKMLSLDRAEHGLVRSSVRSSSETQLRKSPSGSTLVFDKEAQANSHVARSRTPSRPRVRAHA